jgi:hypothetical protein
MALEPNASSSGGGGKASTTRTLWKRLVPKERYPVCNLLWKAAGAWGAEAAYCMVAAVDKVAVEHKPARGTLGPGEYKQMFTEVPGNLAQPGLRSC